VNEEVLAAFLAVTFVPYIPFLGGGVFFLVITCLFLAMFSWFMPEDSSK
jgi:hypothetical protein